MAIGTVALGLIIAFSGILGDGLHHLSVATAPGLSGADEKELDSVSHNPIQSAEAATMPMSAIAYATLNVAREGDAAAGPLVVKVTRDHLDNHCEFCTFVEYNPYLAGKAGIALTTAQPLDIQGAQRMVLWARGEYGGEQVRFMILGKQNGTAISIQDENLFENVNFVSKTETVTLSTKFQMYQVDVPQVDPENFNDISHLVAIEIDGENSAGPILVYLKGFIFDAKPPNQDYLLENVDEIATES